MSISESTLVRGKLKAHWRDAIVGRYLSDVDRQGRLRVRPPWWKRVLSSMFTCVTLASVVYFWPALLGGGTNAVVVRGTSMVPVYHLNDMVVARRASHYDVGDIVVYRVPDGAGKGMLIIHRLIGKRADGTWITQGDNRATPDQFELHDSDLQGKPLFVIPRAGRLLQLVANVYVLSLVCGLFVIANLWPARRDDGPEEPLREGEPQHADGPPPLPVDGIEEISFGRDDDWLPPDDVAAEAERWLVDELARLGVSV